MSDQKRRPNINRLLDSFARTDRYLPYPEHDPYLATMGRAGDGGIMGLVVEVEGRKYIKLPADNFTVRRRDGGLQLIVEGAGLRLDHRVAPALMLEIAWQLKQTVGIETEIEEWGQD